MLAFIFWGTVFTVLAVYGAFAVVYANQWLSIDGEKHAGWISFVNVASVPLILKFRCNSFNICLLKSIGIYFI